jgi:hypothetical protein
MQFLNQCIRTFLLIVCAAAVAGAQQPDLPGAPVKLADLLPEAERSNPQIRSARQSWESAQHVPTQV